MRPLKFIKIKNPIGFLQSSPKYLERRFSQLFSSKTCFPEPPFCAVNLLHRKCINVIILYFFLNAAKRHENNFNCLKLTVLYYFICKFLRNAFECASSDYKIVRRSSCSVYKKRAFRQCVKTCVSSGCWLGCRSSCNSCK